MRKAIIMGASSGIGQEVARLLLADGWLLGIAARRQEALENIRADYPGQVVTAQIDVTAEDAPTRLLELIEQRGGVDLYFHASGIGKKNPQLDPSVELNTVRTNALGFTRMIDTVFNYMASHSQSVVSQGKADAPSHDYQIACISSIAGTQGLGPAPSYSATKAFQNTYIQALEQLAISRHIDIRFTDIRPGFVDTDLLKGGHYPLLMDKRQVAREIVKAINRREHVRVIDWRYRVMTRLWRWIPRALWRHFNLLGDQRAK